MNYYNEFDPFAAAWLRELIKAKLIPEGVVDERSIADVDPRDVKEFKQCHWFAGIAGWSLALEYAGWPADRPVWTGSPPCQPFSVAGNKKGKDDLRHLWPVFFNLIRECQPPTVFGEQVSSAIRSEWFCELQADMEKENYACGMVVLPACGIGAPHKRERLFYFAKSLANTSSKRFNREHSLILREKPGWVESNSSETTRGSEADSALANSNSISRGCIERSRETESEQWQSIGNQSGNDMPLANTNNCRQKHEPIERSQSLLNQEAGEWPQRRTGNSSSGLCGGAWDELEYVYCRDGKTRPIPKAQPSFLSLVDGFSNSLGNSSNENLIAMLSGYPLSGLAIPNRAGILKGAGNAIVPQVAAEVIKAYMETEGD